MTNLGRLEKVELRDIWKTEDRDFTPWLATEENIEILSETLGLELEVEAQEQSVGPFRADILCKDLGDDDCLVLIENQLERTDHKHLGQLLTYGAGLKTLKIIWIAEKFTDEHRAALDWLNNITEDGFQFFGLEVELWRIGDSRAAPKFNVISKPNEWSRSVSNASKKVGSINVTETKLQQLKYWEGLYESLQSSRLINPQKPSPKHWTNYSIGRSGMNLAATLNTRENRLGIELYFRDENAKAFFELLREDQNEIEPGINGVLEWQKLPTKRACRIITYLENSDPLDESKWPKYFDWMKARLEEFYKTFNPRVKLLDPEDWTFEDQAETL